MDIGATTSSENGDAVSLDSTAQQLAAVADGNGAAITAADDWFAVLTIPQSIQRTIFILLQHVLVLVRTTVLCLLPSWILAMITAIVHEHEHADPSMYIRELPFTEILQDLPLVLWHLILLMAGCLTAQGYTVRYLAETVYATTTTTTTNGLQTLSNHSSRRSSNSKHGGTKSQPWRPGTLTICTAAAAGLWILLSLTAVALAGHFLAIGLWDLRQNANKTHHKHPHEWILGLIVLTCTVMIFAVAAVTLFGVAWLVTCYITVVPLIVLQQASTASASSSIWSLTASLLDNLQTLATTTGTQMLDVFRQAYVLARGAHNFIDASLFVTIMPVLVAVMLVVSLPLYEASHTLAMDFIAWLGGTPQGVVALYAPAMVVLPILSM